MPNPVGGTEQSSLCTASVDGVSLGTFDTYTGGDAVAKSTKHRPGGLGNEISYISLPSYSDMTISKVLEAAVDWPLVQTLIPKAGKVVGTVTIQPLDADGHTYGTARTASGIFLGVKSIKGDSNSEAVQMYDLDFSVDSSA